MFSLLSPVSLFQTVQLGAGVKHEDDLMSQQHEDQVKTNGYQPASPHPPGFLPILGTTDGLHAHLGESLS